MYSTLNEGKSVISERLMETLKPRIYKRWQLMMGNLILGILIN